MARIVLRPCRVPGGDLFGIALTPPGDGFYYVEDEVNSLVLAR